MRAKLLIAIVVVLLVVLGLSAYIAVAVGNELYEARAALSGPATDLDRATLLDARRHLVNAAEKLDGTAASVLSVVPVAGHAVRAVEDVTEETIPVVDAADALTRKLDAIRALQVVESGRIRLDLVGQLRGPLVRQTEALADLADAAREGRSGWLPPPLWDVLEDLELRARGYLTSAGRGSEVAGLAASMLGQSGPRTYLVVLVNNAELRGAGGIPSAAGTVTAVEGRLTLGRFRHTVDLRGPLPYEKVAAPADFRRRFGFYSADTTFWTNTTFSPDVPDVALVAARAFKKATGTRVDGVLLVDPRGMAALMPEGAGVRVAGTEITVGRDELPDYVYSGVYEDLGGATPGRRRALLAIGQQAFESILEGGGLISSDTLARAGAAVAGGHIRIVSFDPAEQAVLDRVDAGGDLGGSRGDSVLVAAQNFSADKLDYWVHRDVRHSCTVDDEAAACTTEVTLANRAPEGLPRYVAGKPYGVVEDLVEVYVPEDAALGLVESDGHAQVGPDRQDGHHVVGSFLELAPGDRQTLAVSYELPIGPDGYALEVTPQPLARDARLRVRVEAPRGWTFDGAGTESDGVASFSGALDRTIRLTARPAGRSGLAAFWEGLVRFWREPVF
ncbi:MAG TPA: DUF4012 domain-containing protein [Actinomycetota bacterium]|nr:DUF4012 domain-containing protein [Actinomycetota bacterium]